MKTRLLKLVNRGNSLQKYSISIYSKPHIMYLPTAWTRNRGVDSVQTWQTHKRTATLLNYYIECHFGLLANFAWQKSQRHQTWRLYRFFIHFFFLLFTYQKCFIIHCSEFLVIFFLEITTFIARLLSFRICFSGTMIAQRSFNPQKISG